jgi:hypothetical protein
MFFLSGESMHVVVDVVMMVHITAFIPSRFRHFPKDKQSPHMPCAHDRAEFQRVSNTR